MEYLEPHRLIAAPGDLCFFRPLVGGVPFPLPCSEGDDPSGNVPSVGGAACFDGIDNDNDGVIDAADSDCQGTVNYIRFDAEPTDGYETFYRGVAFLCFNPGERIAGLRSFAQGPGQWDTGEASTFQTMVKCEAN